MKNKLEIKNLTVEAGNKVIVDDVSITINQGEIHVIMGPNGSGKSSLLNAIMGHPKYKIASGNIFFDNEDITAISTDKKAKKGLFLSMQYLPEIEGVTMMSFLHKAYEQLKVIMVPILDFYKYLENIAIELNIDKSFLKRSINSGFSGGEKKQGEVLQLVALEPKFAFLDEIDSGVDVDSMEKIFKGINMLKEKGTGFVIVTHYGQIFEKIKPDFVHIMKDGKIVRSGGSEIAKEVGEKGFAG